MLWWHSEALVEAGEEVSEHAVSIIDGDRARESQFGYEPVLEGAGIRSTRPLACGGRVNISCTPSSSIARLNWVGAPAASDGGVVLEYGMSVCIQCGRYAAVPYQTPHQQEVAVGILQLAEQGIDHYPSGVIHCKQQRELRSIFSQPSVVAAVYLNQHTLAWHPLPPNAVLRRATPTRTVHTGVRQYLAQRVTTDVYALPLPQQARSGAYG